MDDNLELTPNLQTARDAQTKFSYYLVALCVASIGFSVAQTVGEGLSYYKIPLGLSVLAFGYSIYAGLNFIRTIVASMHWEIHFLKERDNISRGQDDDEIKNQKDWAVYDKQNLMAVQLTKETIVYSKRQRDFFITGIVLFVVWRVLEMHLITISAGPCS